MVWVGGGGGWGDMDEKFSASLAWNPTSYRVHVGSEDVVSGSCKEEQHEKSCNY